MELETSGFCNRVCAACIRNSHPERAIVQPWFASSLLPMETIREVFRQTAELGFQGRVCLAHFNEPLLDTRTVEIVKLAKTGPGVFVYVITNGDFLTRSVAQELDGILDRIVVSLYVTDRRMRERRKAAVRSLFTRTQIVFKGKHTITHFAPEAPELIQRTKDLPCTNFNRRLVINHLGEYLLCCEDINGAFDLGSFPETSLKDYWYGARRAKVIGDLRQAGGRKEYPYCLICPR